ncbi:hypothetical protein BDA99DRAFT_557547 [Phascolomyces articulosus]|uniref:Uncharacterized protein n=1 Tax=Phascolomyces articulosus TaxID=60185 RepID=A0AAD5K6C4_9FUNG|nr:hypothetical protein BDA99DRAFT_557547 [Phascolomyces articulosus]
MLDGIQTFTYPDVTPAKLSLKRNNSLPPPLEMLSNGDLSSTSYFVSLSKNNNKIINGADPRMMPPPPRIAIVRNNKLMGRSVAVNAATSSTVRSRSLWNTTTTQDRIPCPPPTPPDSVASSENNIACESSPKQRNSLPLYPLPVFKNTYQKTISPILQRQIRL